MRFARRPHLVLTVGDYHVHSRVEGDGWPYIRILVRNGRFCRGAKGARVLVESYRQCRESLANRVTLGSPSLGWTSGGAEARADGSLTVPPGVSRPVDLGYLNTTATDMHGDHQPPSMANQWGLQLGLHELRLTDGRDRITYGRWTIRLIATADDAATETYDLTIEWGPAEMTAQDVLDSVRMDIVKV